MSKHCVRTAFTIAADICPGAAWKGTQIPNMSEMTSRTVYKEERENNFIYIFFFLSFLLLGYPDFQSLTTIRRQQYIHETRGCHRGRKTAKIVTLVRSVHLLIQRDVIYIYTQVCALDKYVKGALSYLKRVSFRLFACLFVRIVICQSCVEQTLFFPPEIANKTSWKCNLMGGRCLKYAIILSWTYCVIYNYIYNLFGISGFVPVYFRF